MVLWSNAGFLGIQVQARAGAGCRRCAVWCWVCRARWRQQSRDQLESRLAASTGAGTQHDMFMPLTLPAPAPHPSHRRLVVNAAAVVGALVIVIVALIRSAKLEKVPAFQPGYGRRESCCHGRPKTEYGRSACPGCRGENIGPALAKWFYCSASPSLAGLGSGSARPKVA